MRKLKLGLLLSLLGGVVCLLSGCGTLDDSFLDSQADFTVLINIPYPTMTPQPAYLNAANPVIIDSEGKVTVNDASFLTSYTLGGNNGTTSSYQTLSLGNTGLAVQALQQRLQDLGYYTSGVSGIFDAATEKAVKRFEQTYGVMQTGIATPAFQTKLFASNALVYGSPEYQDAVDSHYNTLQRGATGSAVYALQHRLKELGYPISELTAIYDEQTEAAVAQFYVTYGLSPQTVANRGLQKELYSENALSYASNSGQSNIVIDSTTLVRGNVGTLIMQIQERLILLGYMSGTPSGIFDAETEVAARLFEEACGFEPTGTLRYELQAILLSDEAPSYGSFYEASTQTYTDLIEGSVGEAVTALQNRLIELGYATGSGNGVYGPETAAAIKMFSRYNGFTESGNATAEVQAKLFSHTALSYQDVLNGIVSRDTASTTATPVPSRSPGDVDFTSDYFPLTLGSRGSDVTKLQTRLNELLYECNASGIYDESTVSAMRDFQAAIGITQSGDASVSMQQYLYSYAAPQKGLRFYNATQDYTTLQEGDTGEAVIILQHRLWELGYLLTESVENSIGTYHNATRLAVASAQLAMGYENTDGIASPEFQCFLLSQYGKYIKK